MTMIAIEILRTRLGLDSADTSKDNEIILADATAQAMLEKWLDRILTYGTESERFVHHRGHTVSLRRYPVDADSVVVTPELPFHVDLENGVVHFDQRVHEHELLVAYSGGYIQFPPALYTVALMLTDDAFTVLNGNAGSGQFGEVRSINVPDVGTVQFATGRDSTVTGSVSASYGVPSAYAGVIELFRRRYA